MNALGWMVGGSLASWLVVTTLAPRPVNPEVWWGMAGPLAASVITWLLVERAHARAPERVMNVLMPAFGVKMLFFGVYVAVMLRGVGLRPIPFVVSFTAYFIGLYAMQALFLQRLR